MHTDPIADFLTRIRNASSAGHARVTIPASKVKKALAQILEERGFIKKAQTEKEGKFEIIALTLDPEKPPVHLIRKSTPGQRKYLAASEIRPVRNGYGIGIISTSKGMMTTEEAKEKGIGGEYICEVY